MIERKSPATEETLRFHHESWSLVDVTTPRLVKNTNISISWDTPKWKFCKTLADDKGQLVGPRVSFTPNLAYLRIGPLFFTRNSSGEYIKMHTLSRLIENSPNHFEDITNRGQYLVLTSRRKPSTSEVRGRTTDRGLRQNKLNEGDRSLLGKDLESTQCQLCSREPSRSNHGSETHPAVKSEEGEDDSEGSPDPTASEESEWNSAEESWSEGSTETDQDDNMPLNTISSSEEVHESASNSEIGSEDEDEMLEDEVPVHSFGQLKKEFDSDGGDIDFDCGSEDGAYDGDSDFSDVNSVSDNVEFDSDDGESPRPRMFLPRTPKPAANGQKGLLTIYNLQSGHPVQIFQYSQRLPITLYDSPPVIHPTDPLVVWPLCGGEVLFANFQDKTYFVRKARPSTPKSPPFFPSLPNKTFANEHP